MIDMYDRYAEVCVRDILDFIAELNSYSRYAGIYGRAGVCTVDMLYSVDGLKSVKWIRRWAEVCTVDMPELKNGLISVQ
jgi:hypothetical protein